MFPRAKAPPVKSDTALASHARVVSKVTEIASLIAGLNENEYRWGSKVNRIQVSNSGESIVKL